MAIDVLTEKLRSFVEAANWLPKLRGGKSVNPSTVWRWTTQGVRARDGTLVRLEAIKVGGTCCTSDEALLRFLQTLSAAPVSDGMTRLSIHDTGSLRSTQQDKT